MTAVQELVAINPATEEEVARVPVADARRTELALSRAGQAFGAWRRTSIAERCARLADLAKFVRANRDRLARLATNEMGKPITQARAEVDKCAWACDYYATEGPRLLAPQRRLTSGSEAYVQFLPLGVALAIMPWNFPFWQVFRFAAPSVLVGNVAILKHAANVPQCAAACEEAFTKACGQGILQNLYLDAESAGRLVSHPSIAAVTLTGSERAGAAVAEAAGRAIKKSVLELGGSDPFIVLEDADIEDCVSAAVRARYQNTGQSCIAAKRFIVVERIYTKFRDAFVRASKQLRVGDPLDDTVDMGPLARKDLCEELERQIAESTAGGARILAGGSRMRRRGYFFEPTVIECEHPDVAVCEEETFGPVAALLSVRDEEEAVRMANRSRYGLGASLWTRDVERAKHLAGEIQSGQVFINGIVSSDPRLPFGGVKHSGYGRELAEYGIRELANIQTVWVG